ncbi:MAG: DUF4124 domain-containing protein [Gammaproteobacteria bacterium]
MKANLLVLGILFSASAFADVYKCTDGSGKTIYRAAPCAPGQENVQINISTGSSTNLTEEQRLADLKDEEQQMKREQEKLERQQLEERQTKLKQEARDENSKTRFLIKNNLQKYSPFAIPPYNPDDLPVLVMNFRNRLPEIERLRRIAAEKALAAHQCSRVESSELTIESTPKSLVFGVGCSNSTTFYFTEQELTP